MVDIIDVVLAKSLTPQGQIDTYAAKANKAVADAAKAESDMNSLIESLTAAVEEAEENNSAVTEKLQQVDAALESLDVATDVNDEIDKLAVTLNAVSSANATTKNIIMSYPSGKSEVMENVVKYYNGLGNNTDGTMTQKAITDAINNIEIHGGGDVTIINLGPENSGKTVIVGDDGNISAGVVTEDELITALLKSDSYIAENALGLEMDYENKSNSRRQNASTANFNNYSMYGGRMRCNVADDGTINAFYGDTTYKDDGSNGQVMVYQPKFYYKRIPTKIENGTIIRSEILIVSPTAQQGFKLHPIFKAENGEELEYVLLPAYEGSVYSNANSEYATSENITIDFSNDKLSSVANTKPISGENNDLTSIAAEQLAKNRGEGWHITNMAAESATQMLEIVEFGTMNMQVALGAGITALPTSSKNNASLTGSTAALGNSSGSALSTINEIDGVQTTYTESGKVAVSYRGQENLWGNIWRFIGGVNVYGDGSLEGGMPYICRDFNYDINSLNNYIPLGFTIPSTQNWISAMGYNENFDWVFMPIENTNGNSAVPVGDSIFPTTNLNGINIALIGGHASFESRAGAFFYGCDKKSTSFGKAYGANLMFIPQKNSIYNSNYQKWLAKMGG